MSVSEEWPSAARSEENQKGRVTHKAGLNGEQRKRLEGGGGAADFCLFSTWLRISARLTYIPCPTVPCALNVDFMICFEPLQGAWMKATQRTQPFSNNTTVPVSAEYYVTKPDNLQGQNYTEKPCFEKPKTNQTKPKQQQ